MKLSDLASPSATAWIVALATLGAVSLIPSRPAPDETRVPRPPIADVTVAAPALRADPREGVDDMYLLDDGRGEDDRYAYPLRPYADPES